MKRISSKSIVLLAMAVVILLGATGGTIAWITMNTAPVKNTFDPGKVTCSVADTMSSDGLQKTSITIKNTGNTDAYIRVAVIGNWCDAQGNIVAPWNGGISNTSAWTSIGPYYYCNSIIAPGGYTLELLDSPIDGKYVPEGCPEGTHLVIDVLAQAIQSEPDDARTYAGWPVF